MGTSARIDRQHVNLGTEAAALYWETKLGAQRDAIREALEEVGDDPATVSRWLAAHHKAHERVAERRPQG